jgi:hypothetical protein
MENDNENSSLLTPGASAQQNQPAQKQEGQQTTDDQKSFKNNVQAQPTTKKREDIIRSETSEPNAATAPKR